MNQGFVLIIDAILQHHFNSTTQEFEFLIHWKGFTSIEDAWEPLRTLFADVPQAILVHNYVDAQPIADQNRVSNKKCD